MDWGAQFQYKCRLCGMVYSGECCISLEVAKRALECVAKGIEMKEHPPHSTPPTTIVHISCEVGRGLSDLVGYITVSAV